MKTKQIRKPTQLAALLAGVAMLGLVSQNALALGTASGVSIDNMATLNYSVGAAPQTAILSSPDGLTPTGVPTTFTVDNKAIITVAASDAAVELIGPGVTGVLGEFTVTNNGNTIQDVTLLGADLATATVLGTPAATDAFNNTGVTVFVDTDPDGAGPLLPNGTYGPEDTATFIDELPANSSVKVFVVGTTPAVQPNGTQAVVSLVATVAAGGTVGGAPGTALTNAGLATAGVDVVLADAIGTDDTNPAAPIGDGKHSARDAAQIASAVISVAKTAAVLCDPANGITNPKNIPGSIVQWTIVVTNSGAASATLGTIADTLNANTTHESGTGAGLTAPTNAATCVAGAGTSGVNIASSAIGRALGGTAGNMTNAADADGATATASSVAIDFTTALPAGGAYAVGELKAGESTTVKFNVTIN